MLRRESKAWMVTINNPEKPFSDPPIDFGGFRRPPMYALYQLELGENQTPHFQLYVFFEDKIRGSTLRRALGNRGHLELRKGNHTEVLFQFFLLFILFIYFHSLPFLGLF